MSCERAGTTSGAGRGFGRSWSSSGSSNAATSGAVFVLGPNVAKHDLGGAAGWGPDPHRPDGRVHRLSGIFLLRWRPRRLLLTATLGAFGIALPSLALARPLPLIAVMVFAFIAGTCMEIFGVLWGTAAQQEIPQEKLSRISSYDALGSWALMPLGFAAAGPCRRRDRRSCNLSRRRNHRRSLFGARPAFARRADTRTTRLATPPPNRPLRTRSADAAHTHAGVRRPSRWLKRSLA